MVSKDQSKLTYIIGFLALSFLGLFLCPMQTFAYFGVDEDYLLRTEKPTERGESPYHCLEFVSEDGEDCIVQAGDTLWGIARKYYGSGTAYQKLWEDNAERVDRPETLQIGTRLQLENRYYVNVGMQDYIRDYVMHERQISGPSAWEWEEDGYPYQIFGMMSYRNDLGEKDPFRNWEAFQREITDCGRRLCGDRVSELSFERYHVTDVCDLCWYQFVFDGDSGKYLIMAAFVYTGEIENEVFTVQNGYGEILPFSRQYMKNEVFTVCDLDRCDETLLKEARGKTFYMAARTIDSGVYLPKMEDYAGAEDWNYPELHNPFIQAMRSFCDESSAYAGSGLDEQARKDGTVDAQQKSTGGVNIESKEIYWEDSVLEELVREQLAKLWQLTDEERAAFEKRQLTEADLAGIKCLCLYENRKEKKVLLQLNRYEKSRGRFLFDEENTSERDQSILTTLDDLSHFSGLSRVDLCMRESNLTDFSALEEIAGLRELCIEIENAQKKMENKNLAFLGELKDLRLLYLYGWDHKDGGLLAEPTDSFEKITDLSILENCPRLAYLKLTTGNVENYDFLGKLAELHYVDLMGQDDMLNLEPDTSLMPNACFIDYYEEQIRFDIGRTREIRDDEY